MRRNCISTVGAASLAMLMLAPVAGFAATAQPQPGTDPVVQGAADDVLLAQMGGGPGMMAPGQGIGPSPCQGYGPGYGMGPGMMMGQGMGPGMMGPGMMGQGYGSAGGMMGQGMGPGMMGQGYGMMAPGQGYGPGSGMMGQGVPGQGYGMGPGMMGPGVGQGMGPGMVAPGQGYGPGPGMMAPGYGYGPQPGYGMGAAPDQDLSVDDVRARLDRSLAWHGNPRLAVGDVTETDANTITADIVTKDGSLVQRFVIDRQSGAMRMSE